MGEEPENRPDATSTLPWTTLGGSNKRPADSSDDLDTSAVGRDRLPKRRVIIACEVCRLRKTRCDSARPACSFCSHQGLECVYRKTFTVAATQKSPDEQTNQDLAARLERIELILQTQHSHLAPDQAPGSRNELGTPRSGCSGRNPLGPSTSTASNPSITPQGSLPSFLDEDQESGPHFAGVNLHGFGKIQGWACASVLLPLLNDDEESFLERESQCIDVILTPAPSDDLSTLDLSFRTCWVNQQCFVRDVLTWFPLFDQEMCTESVRHASEISWDPADPSTTISLFILALGALSRESDASSSPITAATPGLGFFRAASRFLSLNLSHKFDITTVQCYILKAFWLLLCLRSLAAFDALHQASTIVTRLISRKTLMQNEPSLKEACHRAYWICYLLEHELRVCVHHGSELVQPIQDRVSLPFSQGHEPGLFWFMSEIALRRIFVNGLFRLGRHATGAYAPVVAKELSSQLAQWYLHLHPSVTFPLGSVPLLDPRKAYLRAQYYAALFQVYWSFTVRLLTRPPDNYDSPEASAMLDAAAKSIEYALTHFDTVIGLVQERHMMLFSSQTSLFVHIMMLLCIIDVPEIAALHDVASTIQSVRRARNMLAIWATTDVTVAANLNRVDALFLEKGIQVYDG